jgi:hypothetical protein
MIRLLPGSIRKSKAIKYLQAAQLQSIGLSSVDLSATLVDDTSIDATSCHPCCEHQAGIGSAFRVVHRKLEG